MNTSGLSVNKDSPITYIYLHHFIVLNKIYYASLQMFQLRHARTGLLILVSLLLHIAIIAEATNSTLEWVHQNGTNSSVESFSPWLRRVRNPRVPGCWFRPWICNQGVVPPKINNRCCRNVCVDVFTDVNNCGLCGVRCPYNWQCCQGLCINTFVNPFHCGSCDHRCPFLSICSYGMCGYAQPLPPFPFPPRPPKPPLPPKPPFPFPPRPPKPPFPFPPRHPKPPFPFPPKPPKPPKRVRGHHRKRKGHPAAAPPPPS